MSSSNTVSCLYDLLDISSAGEWRDDGKIILNRPSANTELQKIKFRSFSANIRSDIANLSSPTMKVQLCCNIEFLGTPANQVINRPVLENTPISLVIQNQTGQLIFSGGTSNIILEEFDVPLLYSFEESFKNMLNQLKNELGKILGLVSKSSSIYPYLTFLSSDSNPPQKVTFPPVKGYNSTDYMWWTVVSASNALNYHTTYAEDTGKITMSPIDQNKKMQYVRWIDSELAHGVAYGDFDYRVGVLHQPAVPFSVTQYFVGSSSASFTYALPNITEACYVYAIDSYADEPSQGHLLWTAYAFASEYKPEYNLEIRKANPSISVSRYIYSPNGETTLADASVMITKIFEEMNKIDPNCVLFKIAGDEYNLYPILFTRRGNMDYVSIQSIRIDSFKPNREWYEYLIEAAEDVNFVDNFKSVGGQFLWMEPSNWTLNYTDRMQEIFNVTDSSGLYKPVILPDAILNGKRSSCALFYSAGQFLIYTDYNYDYTFIQYVNDELVVIKRNYNGKTLKKSFENYMTMYNSSDSDYEDVTQAFTNHPQQAPTNVFNKFCSYGSTYYSMDPADWTKFYTFSNSNVSVYANEETFVPQTPAVISWLNDQHITPTRQFCYSSSMDTESLYENLFKMVDNVISLPSIQLKSTTTDECVNLTFYPKFITEPSIVTFDPNYVQTSILSNDYTYSSTVAPSMTFVQRNMENFYYISDQDLYAKIETYLQLNQTDQTLKLVSSALPTLNNIVFYLDEVAQVDFKDALVPSATSCIELTIVDSEGNVMTPALATGIYSNITICLDWEFA